MLLYEQILTAAKEKEITNNIAKKKLEEVFNKVGLGRY